MGSFFFSLLFQRVTGHAAKYLYIYIYYMAGESVEHDT